MTQIHTNQKLIENVRSDHGQNWCGQYDGETLKLTGSEE